MYSKPSAFPEALFNVGALRFPFLVTCELEAPASFGTIDHVNTSLIPVFAFQHTLIHRLTHSTA